MRKGPKRGHFSRSRSLEQMNEKFGEQAIQKGIRKAIKDASGAGRKVRVLEVGCGEARVLMELAKLFPGVEFHGINKKPWPAMLGRGSLNQTARLYKILTVRELKGFSFPIIHFYDASKLKFPDNYFDIIISQVSIPYIKDKQSFLEETWRVLKFGGKAILHIDTFLDRSPDFLKGETPRFVIYKDGKQYSLKRLLADVRKKGFNIKSSRHVLADKKKTQIILSIAKNKHTALHLGLKFDAFSSFDLGVLNKEKSDWAIYWGYRSVYRL